MIRPGAKRTLLDKRDYSFHRTFAGTTELPLMSYDLSFTRNMPDQNADGLPYGCTGYTQAEIAQDIDKKLYNPLFTYAKTCEVEGHQTDTGCDIRTSLKVGMVYGVMPAGSSDPSEALQNRRGPFFAVDKAPGSDWFDSMRLAMRRAWKPISVGTLWFTEWANPGISGILPVPTSFDGRWDTEMGHNYKICGETVIDGKPYLKARTWQGPQWGDGGLCYFSRETFNKAFDVYGTCAFIQGPYEPKDIYTIRLTLLQFALLYLGRLIGLKAYA